MPAVQLVLELAMLSAGLLTGASLDSREADVRLVGNTIEYRGTLSAQANEQAFALFEAAQPKPTWIAIDSKGGSATAGMQLGWWMIEHSLDVAVSHVCLSSCASYVFTAGRIKRLGPHATLLWHGGATQPLSNAELNRLLEETLSEMTQRDAAELLRHRSKENLLADLEQSRAQLIADERNYFRILGIDARIATLGHLYAPQLSLPDEHFLGWDYSLQDLARLGVHDVVVAGDAAWNPAREIDGGKIFRLELNKLEQFVPTYGTE